MPTQDYTLRIIIKALNQASGPLKQTASQLDKIGKTATRVGTVMTAAITVPLVAAGAAGVKMATDLDESMRNIQSVGRQTEEELAGLSKTFVDMSMNADITRDSAQNLAEAFFTIQGSGFAGEEAMIVLEAATKAASAGMTETEVAAEALAGVINSYGLAADDASGISDLLFRTVDRGVGSFEELSGATGRVVGTASQAGVSFEEVSAALATMSKQGISFTEGSTALNQVLLGFIKPSEAMEAAIKGLGFASGQAMLDELGLAGSIKALEDAGHGGTEAMSALFGNVRALKGALALTGAGAEIFAEDLAAMADASGTTAEAFEIQMQSFAAQMAVFKNTLNAALIEVGQVIIPILSDFLKALLPVLKAFANAPEPVQKAVVAFLALLAVLGPILVIVGQLITAWGAVSGAVAAVGAALPAVGTAFASVGAVIGGVSAVAVVGLIAAIVALIAVFVRWGGQASLAERAFETLKTVIRGTGEVVAALSTRLGEQLREGGAVEAFQGMGDAIASTFKFIGASADSGDAANDWIMGVPEIIKPAVRALGELAAIPKTIERAFHFIFTDQFPEAQQRFLDSLPNLIAGVTEVAALAMRRFRERFTEEMVGFEPHIAIAIVFNEFLNGVIDGVQGFIELVPQLVASVRDSVMAIVNAVAGAIAQLPAVIAGVAVNLAAALLALAGQLREAGIALVKRVKEWFVGIKDAILAWIKGLPGLLRSGFEQLRVVVQQIAERLIDFLRTLPQRVMEFGRQIIQGLIDGMQAKLNELVAMLRNIVAEIKRTLQVAFEIRSPSKVMVKLGEQVMAGFAQGMNSAQVMTAAMSATGASAPATLVPALAGVGGGGININGPITIVANDPRDFMRQLTREAKRRGVSNS